MRRALEVLVLISTTVILIATSRAPDHCATESVVLHARTTCGPESNVVVNSSTSCAVTSSGGQLPASGSVLGVGNDAGVMGGFELFGPRVDGGVAYVCRALPADGGLSLDCTPNVSCVADAGPDGGACEPECSGFLSAP